METPGFAAPAIFTARVKYGALSASRIGSLIPVVRSPVPMETEMEVGDDTGLLLVVYFLQPKYFLTKSLLLLKSRV
jgi:hypothetical protein